MLASSTLKQGCVEGYTFPGGISGKKIQKDRDAVRQDRIKSTMDVAEAPVVADTAAQMRAMVLADSVEKSCVPPGIGKDAVNVVENCVNDAQPAINPVGRQFEDTESENSVQSARQVLHVPHGPFSDPTAESIANGGKKHDPNWYVKIETHRQQEFDFMKNHGGIYQIKLGGMRAMFPYGYLRKNILQNNPEHAIPEVPFYGEGTAIMIADPVLAYEILKNKNTFPKRGYGDHTVTNRDADLWQSDTALTFADDNSKSFEARAIMQPAFQKSEMNGFMPTIQKLARYHVDRLAGFEAGGPKEGSPKFIQEDQNINKKAQNATTGSGELAVGEEMHTIMADIAMEFLGFHESNSEKSTKIENHESGYKNRDHQLQSAKRIGRLVAQSKFALNRAPWIQDFLDSWQKQGPAAWAQMFQSAGDTFATADGLTREVMRVIQRMIKDSFEEDEYYARRHQQAPDQENLNFVSQESDQSQDRDHAQQESRDTEKISQKNSETENETEESQTHCPYTASKDFVTKNFVTEIVTEMVEMCQAYFKNNPLRQLATNGLEKTAVMPVLKMLSTRSDEEKHAAAAMQRTFDALQQDRAALLESTSKEVDRSSSDMNALEKLEKSSFDMMESKTCPFGFDSVFAGKETSSSTDSDVTDVEERETSNLNSRRKQTVLHRLLTEANPRSKEHQSTQEVVSNAASVVFAAVESTATSMTGMLTNLSEHPEVYDKLWDEVQQVLLLGGSEDQSSEDQKLREDQNSPTTSNMWTSITDDQLKRMPYLNQVVKENQRMWSAFSYIWRQAPTDRDTIIGDKWVTVPLATTVGAPGVISVFNSKDGSKTVLSKDGKTGLFPKSDLQHDGLNEEKKDEKTMGKENSEKHHHTTKEIYVPPYLIPRGSTLLFSLNSIENNPNYYVDPETFNPDRFSKENEKLLPPGASSLYAFGFGHRVCPGRDLSLIIQKLLLIEIVKKFRRIHLTTEPKVDSYIVVDIGNVKVKLEKRD